MIKSVHVTETCDCDYKSQMTILQHRKRVSTGHFVLSKATLKIYPHIKNNWYSDGRT